MMDPKRAKCDRGEARVHYTAKGPPDQVSGNPRLGSSVEAQLSTNRYIIVVQAISASVPASDVILCRLYACTVSL